MKRINVRAVFLGGLSGFAMDMVAGAALYVFVAFAASDDIVLLARDRDALGAIAHDPAFLAGALLLGTVTTGIAAYITASLVERSPYLNALVMGVAALALTGFLAVEYPFWFNGATVLLTLPSCLVGAHVRVFQRRNPPNQALQTTPMTRSGSEKTIVFGCDQRGV